MLNAGAHLFNREPPQEWLDEHKSRLAELEAPLECDTITVLIFRLSNECLALDVRSMLEVAAPRCVHRVPHRTGGNLEGIVNIRGELQLCVSLARLLNLPSTSIDKPDSENLASWSPNMVDNAGCSGG